MPGDHYVASGSRPSSATATICDIQLNNGDIRIFANSTPAPQESGHVGKNRSRPARDQASKNAPPVLAAQRL